MPLHVVGEIEGSSSPIRPPIDVRRVDYGPPVVIGIESLVADAATALRGRRLTVADTAVELPATGGLYAVYADEDAQSELALPDLEAEELPIYVGKAEDSLRVRDSQAHFQVGKTGQSTLRRSIAALLRESHGLRGQPRNTAKPGYFANFGLSDEHDAILQAWIERHLTLGVWEKPAAAVDLDGKLLAHVEKGVVGLWAPPLNDIHNPRKWKALRGVRAVMVDDARTWRPSG